MAQYLVKSGALCFSVCDRGFHALIYAVLGLSLPMVEWACRLGCDPNHRTVGGFTALHAAVAQPDKGEREAEICAILEFLINEGARIDRRMRPMPGEIADANHLPEAAQILWSQTPEQPSFHDSPIYLAIPVEVYSLMARGADINEKDSTGMTPLSRAAMGGAYETALILIEEGADITAVDHQGWTALHYLGLCGKGRDAANLAEKLIGMGLDVGTQCASGHTAFFYAKWQSRVEMMEVLKKHGAAEEDGDA
jgi:hypothetical protein